MLKNKSIILFFTIALLLCSAVSTLAVKPRFSTYQSKGKFERGTLHNISVLHRGVLTPSPAVKKMMETQNPFIWSSTSDSKGNVYLGTGNEGIVYKITAKGDTSILLDTEELEVYALATDHYNNVYAGTSPRGKVYKIKPDGSSSVFYTPKSDYIWDLAVDKKGNLYVATGSIATITKITPDGIASVLMASEQTHIKSIYIHENTIYAGSSGNGYVYRIEQNGNPFVILDTQMQEVHDLLVTPDGTIYAAAFGETTAMFPGQQKERKDSGSSSNGDNGKEEGESEASFAQSFLMENMAQTAQTPTALFRIDKNGYSKDLWLGSEERIQSLLQTKDGEILAGTGDHGKLYSIDKQGNSSLVLSIDESQITTMIYGLDHKLLIGTSNLGVAYMVLPEKSAKAEYESETIDTGLQSIWGTLAWKGQKNSGSVEFYTRSGNTEIPEQSWSKWQKTNLENGAIKIKSPSARYIQWKCEMTAGKNAPQIREVNIAYMQKNLAPSISDIIIHKPGTNFKVETSESLKEKGIPYPQNPSQEEDKPGYQSIDWLFEDPNFDGILFDVYYKQNGTKHWKNLTTDLPASSYSWDSNQMADGEYVVKIVAKDSPANTKEMSLTGEQISESFVIDNTGPEINSVVFKNNTLTFTIKDTWNNIENVFFSINANTWSKVYPVDSINDSKQESYKVAITTPLPFEIAIKTHDNVNNVTVIHKEIE